MSLVLERGTGGIGRPGFAGGGFGIYGDSVEVESHSSSIGRNSDSSGGGSDGGDESEVQSALKGPLDTMDALEDSLPIRRGISQFYRGKSKSFTSLADARRVSSAKDLAKPENSYTRKRKSLLAFSAALCDKTCSSGSPRRDEDAPAVSKRPANSSRTTVALVHPESSSSGSNSSSSGSAEEDHDHDRGHPRQLPPLHPHGKRAAQKCSSPLQRRPSFKLRSFSLTDLEGAASTNPSMETGVKQNMFR